MSEWKLADESATMQFGERFGKQLPSSLLVFLLGDLGAGKTTLVRGLLRGLGETGSIKSPTYTLVESYRVARKQIHHFDLYRLADPEELEYMGFRDYLDTENICFVEWPQRGGDLLPQSDVTIQLSVSGTGRLVSLQGHTEIGKNLVHRLSKQASQKV